MLLLPCALIGGAVAARYLAEGFIADKLTEEAKARGVTTSWESLELGYDLRLVIKGLAASKGDDLLMTLEEAHIEWDFDDLLSGRRAPRGITLSGLDLRVDPAALRASGVSATAEGSPPGEGQERGLMDKIAPLFETAVVLERARVQARGLPGPTPEVLLTDLSMKASPSDGDRWKGEAVGVCERGCGAGPQEVKASALWGMLGLELKATLERPVTVEVPLPGQEGLTPVTVAGVDALLPRHGGRPTLGALGVALPIDQRGLLGSARIERVEVELPEGGGLPKRVALQRPLIELERPANPAPQQELLRAERPKVRMPALVPEVSTRARLLAALPAPSEILAIRDKILPLLDKIEVEDGALRVREAGGRELLALKGVQIRHDGEAVRVALSDRGGEISATLVAGTDTIAVDLDGVSIDRAEQLQDHVDQLKTRKRWRLEGTLNGRLRVRFGGEAFKAAPMTYIEDRGQVGGFHVEGALELSGGLLYVKGLSPGPIDGQRARIAFNASYQPPGPEGQSDRLTARSVKVELPSRGHEGRWAEARAEVEVEHVLDGESTEIAARLWVPSLDCGVAFGAIPKGMLPNLHDQLKASGAFAPDLTFQINVANPYGLEMDLKGLPGDCALASLGKFSPDYLKDDFAQEVREGVSRSGILVGPDSGSYVKIYNVPDYVRAITYMTEEGGFYKSAGFSLNLIKRAVRLNVHKGRYAYGGSTISQQLVKNLFMTRQKTLSRKLEEAFIVWRMEEVLTKDRILELYLNCIEYGPNIYGIKRAAQFYFGKQPAQLDPIEGAFLAAIKPSPLVGMNFMGPGHTPAIGWWYDRMEGLVRGMNRRGIIGLDQLKAVEPFIVFFRSFSGDRNLFREQVRRQRAGLSGLAVPEGEPADQVAAQTANKPANKPAAQAANKPADKPADQATRQGDKKPAPQTSPLPANARRYRLEELPPGP